MARRIATIDEMIDIISSIRGGLIVSIGYVSVANLYKTMKNVNAEDFGKNLDDSRADIGDENYKMWNDFRTGAVKKFPCGEILKVLTCTLNWQSEVNYNKNYGEYADKRNELLKSFGAEPVFDTQPKKDEMLNFGKGGVSVGATEKTRDRLYTHQNSATINWNAPQNKKSYYIVDKQGEVMDTPVDSRIIKSLSKFNIDGLSSLKKINASEETIKAYASKLKEFKFGVMKMLYDRILYIVATVNGEKIYFINENLNLSFGTGKNETPINTSKILGIARQKAEEACAIQESIIYDSLFKDKLNEYKAARKLSESISRMLKENTARCLNENLCESYIDEGKWLKMRY